MTILRFDKACACSANKATYGPHSVRDETPANLIDHLSIEDKAGFEKAMEQYYIDSSNHEAAHAVAAVATGRGVEYATIGGGAPHVRYSPVDRPPSVLDICITTTAGAVGERIGNGLTWSPTWSRFAGAIRKARAGESGSCDGCHAAKVIVDYFGECDDGTLIESWFGILDATHALMKDDEVRGAMLKLARELHEKTLIEKPHIAEILRPFDLAGAMDRALEPLDLADLLPAWRLHLNANR